MLFVTATALLPTTAHAQMLDAQVISLDVPVMVQGKAMERSG
jgi:hypothetical protein